MQKQKDVKKLYEIEKFKKKFFPTPAQLIDGVNSKNFYPVGMECRKIVSKIVNSKSINAQEKMELLVDFFGKYYIYQQDSTVRFAVFENYYERFVTETSRGVQKNQKLFERFFREMLAENSYIMNRDLRDNSFKILQQAEDEGVSRSDLIDSLDRRTKDIINLALLLDDDYTDKLMFNIYIPSNTESRLKDLICQRYLEKHPEQISEGEKQ